MTPKARVGRPPKSAATTPKKEKQQEDFVPPSDEEEYDEDEEEEDYEDEDDEDFDVGSSKRRKSGGSAGKNSRRGSAVHNTTFVPQAFTNTNSINSSINSQRVGMTSSIDSMQSNISNLLTNISATPSVGAYKPPLIFGNTVSPTDINWNFIAPKPTAPVVSTYNMNQTPVLADNNAMKRTSGQMDPNTAAYGYQPEGQPQLKRQRLDEAELLMGLLPTASASAFAAQQPSVNMSPSVTSAAQPAASIQNVYSMPQQQPISYQQNPFAQAPVFSTQSVMNSYNNNIGLTTSTSSLNNSQPINLFTSDELPQSTQASQVSAANSQDIDQFLNLGPDNQ